MQHHCSLPAAITVGGLLDDTMAYSGMLCSLHDDIIADIDMLFLLHDDIIAYTGMLCLLHDDTIAYSGTLCLLQTTNGCLCCCMHTVSLHPCLDHWVVGYPGQSL